ncbi:MAG: helix-turn-helix domain-containing protein [Planctomycetes bacterium]|nr:helix-turn-helix domain-containing protein [Planctomycetota bacterium]
MAKSFYTAQEAAEMLGKTERELNQMAREGLLREFRDGGKVNYKVEDIDELAGTGALIDTGSASGSAEIILEAAEDSGIELSPSGSDVLSLEEVDAGDTSASTATGKKGDTEAAGKKKGDTVVPSVGINVFDDDDLDEAVDPLAQTAVTDVGGLGIEGVGSGSGILDLTKESDDTSLGAELLEEIYTDENERDTEEVGDTRTGMEGAASEGADEAAEEPFEAESDGEDTSVSDAVTAAAKPRAVAPAMVAVGAGPDAWSAGLTALMAVAVVVMWFSGLAGAGLVRGVVPSLVEGAYGNLAICAGGALGVAIIAGAVTFFLAGRSK